MRAHCLVFLSAFAALPLAAQEPDVALRSLGRAGSGTSWLPDGAMTQPAMAGHAGMAGMPDMDMLPAPWRLSAHGVAFGQAVRVSGTRGTSQTSVVNHLTAQGAGPVAGGLLRARVMLSAEPVTIPDESYPQLLQAAFTRRGDIVTDRAHADAWVMEMALLYERAVSRTLGVSLYVAPIGEPALGPVAYQHRPSAAQDPAPPLGHHAQDDSHASYGVLSAGLFTTRWRIDGSAFNGRRPEAPGRVFAYEDARLDSYAGRVTFNPATAWSLSTSYGYLAPSSGAHAHGAQHRAGAAALYSRAPWNAALIVGANDPVGPGRARLAVLGEASREAGRRAIFARAEWVRRTSAELGLIGSVSPELDIGGLSVGYAHRVATIGRVPAAIGARGILHRVPAELEPFYGTRAPLGATAYLRLGR